ncbi:phospholipase A2 inhibitor alpha-like protein [Eublepharis macularius]|uniref:Phospholipase A2 inhibitor alpha-like protein n=1 Tax=Eublepharis macularius TaxID=481883 RepID=A0AA97L2A7_EUBMA|nr:phospholipase A2 inhibitor alpha-like protein [Eublepharis macularius]
MLLFLAFSALLLGTSLASPQQQQKPECCHEELQSLVVKLNALSEEVKKLNSAFYNVHRARSFGSGSEKLFVTNGHEDNFDAANHTCIQTRGYVPSPKNEAENNALVKVVQRHNKSAYLGHIPSGYSNWAPGEPSSAKGAKTCVKIDNDGKWRATSCEEQLLITCEFTVV